MKCDMCDLEASVFLTQILDGKMTQVNLCEKCSKERGVTDPTGFQLADFLLGAGTQKKAVATEVDDDTLACPECGFTRAHLKKIGRMGCPECYRTFGDDLDSMLRAMHKGTRHVGKAPGKPLSLGDLVKPPAGGNIGGGSAVPSSGIGSGGGSGSSSASAPSAPPSPGQIKKRLTELKHAIDSAILEERYEDAAKLRDEMRAIESMIV